MHELQSHGAERLGKRRNARRAREYPDAGHPALVDAAGRVGPVAGGVVPGARPSVEDAVAARVGAIPELVGNAILHGDEVDLAGDDGLDLARRKVARDTADRRASRQRAGVVDQPVAAGQKRIGEGLPGAIDVDRRRRA